LTPASRGRLLGGDAQHRVVIAAGGAAKIMTKQDDSRVLTRGVLRKSDAGGRSTSCELERSPG